MIKENCNVPLCNAITELNIDVENNEETTTPRYARTWKAYLIASGDRGMINNLPCDCNHKHFVREKCDLE